LANYLNASSSFIRLLNEHVCVPYECELLGVMGKLTDLIRDLSEHLYKKQLFIKFNIIKLFNKVKRGVRT
jgi:hypothetical protein